MKKEPDYTKGTRRDIIYLLHGTGVLTYRALRVLPEPQYNLRTIQQKIKDMEHEGVLARAKPAIRNIQLSFVYIKNYEMLFKRFTVKISQECIDTYLKYFKEDIRKIWQSKDGVANRKLLEADTIVMMYSVGADTMSDQDGGKVKFYNAREIKRHFGYKDEVKEKDGERKVQFSKTFGMLLSVGGNYAVYHSYKSGLTMITSGEYKIRHQLESIAHKIRGDTVPVGNALMLTNELEDLTPYFESDLTAKLAQQYSNMTEAYKTIYVVPYTKFGRDAIKLMTKSDWRNKLIISATGEVQDTSSVDYVCDHYDSENNIGTIVFCIPDIIRIKKFLDTAKIRNDKDRFRIICFDYQHSFVKKIANGYARIYSTPFYNYFREGE